MSRDGVSRINLRVDVRLNLDDVAAAVAMASYEDAETIAEAKAGRERLLGWARDGVRQIGLDHIRMAGADGYEEELLAARQRLVELEIFEAPACGRDRTGQS